MSFMSPSQAHQSAEGQIWLTNRIQYNRNNRFYCQSHSREFVDQLYI